MWRSPVWRLPPPASQPARTRDPSTSILPAVSGKLPGVPLWWQVDTLMVASSGELRRRMGDSRQRPSAPAADAVSSLSARCAWQILHRAKDQMNTLTLSYRLIFHPARYCLSLIIFSYFLCSPFLFFSLLVFSLICHLLTCSSHTPVFHLGQYQSSTLFSFSIFLF